MACALAKQIGCECAKCVHKNEPHCCANYPLFICKMADVESFPVLKLIGGSSHCYNFKPRKEDQNDATD